MSSFQLKIDGPGVAPKTLRLEDLLDTLANLQRAIVAAAVDAGHTRRDVFVALESITSNCTLLTFYESAAAAVGTERVAKAIYERDLALLPRQARDAVRRIWGKAKTKSWTLSLQNGGPPAVVDPARPIPAPQFIVGPTSLFAKIVRIGGKRPKVLVELADGQRRVFPVASMGVADQLGDNTLYRWVVLHGEAKWHRKSHALVDFRVTAVGNYHHGEADPAAAMKRLADVMGHHWQDVDADAYLHEERSGE